MHATTEEASHSSPTETFRTAAEIPHRVRDIAMLRGLGYSFREIAEQLNVTPQAVSLMLSRHRRSIKSLRGALELSNLSARAVNALGRYKITTREQAKAANVLALLRGERNCGRKTLDELERWISDGATPEPHAGGGSADSVLPA